MTYTIPEWKDVVADAKSTLDRPTTHIDKAARALALVVLSLDAELNRRESARDRSKADG